MPISNLMWAVWKARCEYIYEGKMKYVSSILHAAMAQINMAEICRLLQPMHMSEGIELEGSHTQQEGYHCWTDGSFAELDRGGVGYVIYLEDQLVQYEVRYQSAFSEFHIEAWALQLAVSAALSKGIVTCTFRTDSLDRVSGTSQH